MTLGKPRNNGWNDHWGSKMMASMCQEFEQEKPTNWQDRGLLDKKCDFLSTVLKRARKEGLRGFCWTTIGDAASLLIWWEASQYQPRVLGLSICYGV